MIDFLLAFPKAAEFGRIIPKNKIYEHGSSAASIKKIFVDQVDQIRWSFKLAPKTVNLPASNAVQEIQVITITLRVSDLDDVTLQAIDKSIPSPILFELKAADKIQYAACYKRRNEADKTKWVISGYFRSGWMNAESEKQALPVALSMEALYTTLLKELIPLKERSGESIQELVDRADLLRGKQREAEKLKAKRDKEKQFNRRVELNQMYADMQSEIGSLQGSNEGVIS